MSTIDPEIINHGSSIARQLAQRHEDPSPWRLAEYRAKLTADDRAALDAFRAYELRTAIAEVEESDAGASIRRQEAENAYRSLVASNLKALIEGKAK